MNKNENEIIAVVKYMAEQQDAEELTKVWSEPFVWFDTGNAMISGLEKARKIYAGQFEYIENLRTEILTISAEANDDIGFAYSVQHFIADGKNGAPDVDMIFRPTDCFKRIEGE